MMSLALGLVLPVIGVVELTTETFKSRVGGDAGVFIKFFEPGCAHCEDMQPDWEKLGEQYENEGTVIIADVDCTRGESREVRPINISAH